MNIMQYTSVLLYFIVFQVHNLEAKFLEDMITWVRSALPEVQPPEYEGLTMDKDIWHCGSETFKISLKASEFFVKLACEKIMDKINRACWHHDICYNKQKGKSHCDKVFCERLDYLEEKYLSRFNLCPTESMCRAVTYFGGKAYDACKKDSLF